MTSAYAAIVVALSSTAFVLTTHTHIAATVTAVACCAGAVLLLPVVATTQRNATVVRSEAIRLVHRYAAAAAFVAVGVAMAVSAYAAIAEANALIAILGFLGSVLVIRVLWSKPGAVYGLRQKLLLATLGLWIVSIAMAG